MATVKITDLPSITGAGAATADLIPIVDFSTDVTSKMTRGEFFNNIPSNVGIGTSLPLAPLHVNAAATSVSARLSVADVTYATLLASSSTFSLNAVTAIPLTFGTTNTERLRIGPAGQVGIGGANYGTSGQAFLSAGAAAPPTWGNLDLAAGGTGATSAPGAAANLYGYTAVATAAGTTVLTNTSSQYQLFTGTTTQTITLPVTSTLTTGWTFHIVNNSTGNLTVNSSGANLVAVVPSGMTLMVTCILTSGTTAASWEFGFTDFGSITGTGANVLATGPTITGGIYNGTVGATTPSTGAFTTVTASTSIGGPLNGTVGATTPNTGAFTTVTASTSVLSSGAGGVGYSTGAGVAVTQLTSRATAAPTTGNKLSGSITLFTAAGTGAAWTTFIVPNTAIAATDTVTLAIRNASNTYLVVPSVIQAGVSFAVSFVSIVGTAVDTPIINFNIIRGVSA